MTTIITVSLEAQGLTRAPAPGAHGRCRHTMRRERHARFGPRGVAHDRAWTRRCPNPATTTAEGQPVCRQHAPAPRHRDRSPEGS